MKMLLSVTPLMYKYGLEELCSCWKVELDLADWCKCHNNTLQGKATLYAKFAVLNLIQYAVLQVSFAMYKLVLFSSNPSNVANDWLVLFLLTKGDLTSSITKRRPSHESETKPKPKPKTERGGGGLFDGDDEDDLFSGRTSKPSPAPATQGMLFAPKCQCIL